MSDLPIPPKPPVEDPIPGTDTPLEDPVPMEMGHSGGYIAPTKSNQKLLREAMLREGGNMEDTVQD